MGDMNWWAMFFGGIAAAVGIVTLLLMKSQIELARDQTDLSKKQTEMAEKQVQIAAKQDEIISAQLVRAPEFDLAIDWSLSQRDQNEIRLNIRVKNIGSKGVRDYNWYLWLPQRIFEKRSVAKVKQPFEYKIIREAAGVESIDGIEYQRLEGNEKVPLYPCESGLMFVVRGTVEWVNEPFSCLWRIHCEDGRYPADREYGRVEYRLPPKLADVQRE